MRSTTHPVAPEQVQNILLVEDDQDLIALLQMIIKQIFPVANIEHASNVDDTLKLLNTRAMTSNKPPYDLIVADIILDGPGTGLDVWRLCRSLFPGMHVLLTSSLSDAKVRSVTRGIDASPLFMKKPFSVDDCKRLLEATVYRN